MSLINDFGKEPTLEERISALEKIIAPAWEKVKLNPSKFPSHTKITKELLDESAPPFRNVVASYSEVHQLKEELERARTTIARAHLSLHRCMPNEGAWENQCPLCYAKTECGTIPHKPSCALVILTDYNRT